MVMTSPGESWTLLICAMKMAATASYRAVPSMLIVAPIGSTNRVTRLSMPRFSSRQRNVIGKVPALQSASLGLVGATVSAMTFTYLVVLFECLLLSMM